jgi:DNA repair exonuclease SbcCD ATPase subunit
MKRAILILISTFFIISTWAFAAEKSKILLQLESSQAAVDLLAGKVGGNSEASTALEQARASLKKGSDIYAKSRQTFGFNIGFGELKPEAEDEIKNHLQISDIFVATASSRLEAAKAASELETIDKQLASVKAKVKIFEDRKAELEKLRADAAKCQSATRDIEALKSENSRLSGQIEKQLSEIKALSAQLAEAKKEAVKSATPEKIAPPPATIPAATIEPPPASGQEPAKGGTTGK